MGINEILADKFDLPTPIEGDIISRTGEVIVPQDSVDKNVEYDYERTRNNLHSLLTQGQDALIHAIEIAKQSEHPRAFEVVGGLMKQLADINNQLLDLSEKKQKISDHAKPDTAAQQSVTNNNAFFVGSTSDLNKLIKGMVNPPATDSEQ